MKLEFETTAKLPDGLSPGQRIALLEALVESMTVTELKAWAKVARYPQTITAALATRIQEPSDV